jgi:uncharacterized protein YqgC (DUF456 family)
LSVLEVALGLLMLAGLVGTIIPYFPGVPLILAGALLWALFGDAGAAGWAIMVVLALIGGAGMVLGVVLPLRTAAGHNAPRWVLALGLLGVVVGFFVIPVVGALIGGPLAILLAELYRMRDLDEAVRSTVRAIKGIGLGILAEFLAGFVMILIWVTAVLAL